MSAVLDLPPIDESMVPATTEPTQPPKTSTLAEAVVAQFKAIEPGMLALRERYRDVAFDVSTLKGLGEAKAARHELREQGRFAVQRSVDRVKKDVNGLKRLMETEADRLIAITKPTEDAIHSLIEKREAELEEQRQAKAKAEAERKQRLEGGIATIRSYAQRAVGLPSARIAAGIQSLKDMVFDREDWAEYHAQVEQARAETLETLQGMLERTLSQEAEAKRLEEERAELERQRKEIEEARQRAEDQRSEMVVLPSADQHSQESACSTQAGRQDDSPLAAERRGGHAEDCEDLPGVAPGPLHPITPNAEESGSSPGDAQAAGEAPLSCASAIPEAPNGMVVAGDEGAAAQGVLRAADPVDSKMITLGAIKELIAPVSIDAAGLAALGFDPVSTQKSAKLYRERDFPKIVEAMIRHLGGVC